MFVHRAAVTAISAGRSSVASAAFYGRNFARSSSVAASSTARWMSSVDVPTAPTSNHAHKDLAGAEGSIIYTETDEAPALATYSLYPVISKIGALAKIGRGLYVHYSIFCTLL